MLILYVKRLRIIINVLNVIRDMYLGWDNVLLIGGIWVIMYKRVIGKQIIIIIRGILIIIREIAIRVELTIRVVRVAMGIKNC